MSFLVSCGPLVSRSPAKKDDGTGWLPSAPSREGEVRGGEGKEEEGDEEEEEEEPFEKIETDPLVFSREEFDAGKLILCFVRCGNLVFCASYCS